MMNANSIKYIETNKGSKSSATLFKIVITPENPNKAFSKCHSSIEFEVSGLNCI